MSKPFEPPKIRTDEPVEEEEREVFFYLDDVEYTIPKHIKPNLTLKLIDVAAESGQAEAMAWLLRELLGDEAVEALQESDSVTDEQMAELWGYLEKKVAGATRKQLGKSRTGSRR